MRRTAMSTSIPTCSWMRAGADTMDQQQQQMF